MISLNTDQLVSLKDACAMLPKRRGGKRPHVATLHRWATAGCRGVRLETVQVGGTRCTSLAALDTFFQRLSDQSTQLSTDSTSPALRPGSIAEELDREGL